LSGSTPPYHSGFDALAAVGVGPVITGPSTRERNKIGADVILAQDLERLVRGRRAVVRELIDALLSCGHFEPLAGERRLRTRGLLLGGGGLVGGLLG
jgi:hypothetical protein